MLSDSTSAPAKSPATDRANVVGCSYDDHVKNFASPIQRRAPARAGMDASFLV